VNTLALLNLAPLENSFDPEDKEVLQCLEEMTVAVSSQLPSIHTLKRLKELLNGIAVRSFSKIRFGQAPPIQFVAARELVEKLQRTDAYFAWDGPSRGAVWLIGEACRACARARLKLDAWVVERRQDLILGGGEGVPINFRPKPKDLETYYAEAEQELLKRAFFAQQRDLPTQFGEPEKLGKTANIMRALREPPSDYYFVDDVGDFKPYEGPPPIPKASLLSGNMLSSSSSAALLSFSGAQASGGASGADEFSNSAGAVRTTNTSLVPSVSTKSNTTKQDLGDNNAQVVTKDFFTSSKGNRFQQVEWRKEDFTPGGWISQNQQEEKPEKPLTKEKADKGRGEKLIKE